MSRTVHVIIISIPILGIPTNWFLIIFRSPSDEAINIVRTAAISSAEVNVSNIYNNII